MDAGQDIGFLAQPQEDQRLQAIGPEFLISYLDRHDEWAVIVCLVGGGQEIHIGEAGIGEWLESVCLRFQRWRVYVSSNLTDSEYVAESGLERLESSAVSVTWDDRLHLSNIDAVVPL